MERVRVFVDGHVQGVGFRYFVKRQAETYRINGFVKNLPGGKVEIDAEGEPGPLEQFMLACQQGPPHGDVRMFHQQKVTVFGYTRFRIMHCKDY